MDIKVKIPMVLPTTDEEVAAVTELLTKMRQERWLAEAIQQNKEHLEDVVAATVDAIGLEETKRIVRDINRNLRRCSEEQVF